MVLSITILDQKSQWGALEKSVADRILGFETLEPEQCCLDQLYDLSAPFRKTLLFVFIYLFTWPCQV